MCRCPFKDLAESHGGVICALHLGLLRGALEELRAPVQVDALRPFAEPGVCVVELRIQWQRRDSRRDKLRRLMGSSVPCRR